MRYQGVNILLAPNEEDTPMKWLKGTELTQEQRAQVLNAFGFRWTHENLARAELWHDYKRPRSAMYTLESDAQWLAEHCFQFVNDGSRLGTGRNAMPVYLADDLNRKGD